MTINAVKFSHDHRHPISYCLSCQKQLDAALGGQDAPTPGSVSICAYCGNIAIFDETLALRHLTRAERHEIADNPDIKRVADAIKGNRVHHE